MLPLSDDLPSETRGELYSALLESLLNEIELYEPGEWSRGANGELEDESYVPQLITGGLTSPHHQGQFASTWYSSIPKFRESGVNERVLERMIAWGERMWPRGDWAALAD